MRNLISDGTKASMMRLVTFILGCVCALAIVGQITIQIITAAKGNQVYEPNWVALGTMIIMVISGKVVQKFAEKK
jgi:hypothetical protein